MEMWKRCTLQASGKKARTQSLHLVKCPVLKADRPHVVQIKHGEPGVEKCARCRSGNRGGKFCLCESVGWDPILGDQWASPQNSLEVSIMDRNLYTWECTTCKHRWNAAPRQRSSGSSNSGCEVCRDRLPKRDRREPMPVEAGA